MQKFDTEQILKEYNDKTVVASFADAVDSISLWQSEKIIFSKYFDKSMNILDIGCGAGRTTFNLYKLGYTNITGLDLCEGMIESCRKRAQKDNLPITFLNANACELPFANNSFDACIFSFNGLMTIPFLNNRMKVFQEVSRVLKKKGIFIFTTHNIKNSSVTQFWIEEEARWASDNQDSRLNEFGDICFTDKKSGGDIIAFVHIPTYEEVYLYAEKNSFKIVEQSLRSEICEESDAVKEFSADCIFWVFEKQ